MPFSGQSNNERMNNLKMTLNSLQEEKRNLQSQKLTSDIKFEIEIVNNNIETVQGKIDKLMS